MQRTSRLDQRLKIPTFCVVAWPAVSPASNNDNTKTVSNHLNTCNYVIRNRLTLTNRLSYNSIDHKNTQVNTLLVKLEKQVTNLSEFYHNI